MRQLRVNVSDEIMAGLDALVAASTDDRTYFVRLALDEYLAKHQPASSAEPIKEFCVTCGAAVRLGEPFHKDGCAVALNTAAPTVQEPVEEELTPEEQAMFDAAMVQIQQLREDSHGGILDLQQLVNFQ
jgi:hypothetical protein